LLSKLIFYGQLETRNLGLYSRYLAAFTLYLVDMHRQQITQ